MEGKIRIPSYILGKEIFEEDGFSETSLGYGGENAYQRYWAKKLFGDDKVSIEVTSLDSQTKAKSILEELGNRQNKLLNKEIEEISETIKKVGEEVKEDKEFKETENLLSVLYGRSPEIVGLETNMLAESMINNKELIDAQVGGIDKLEEKKPLKIVYNNLAGNAAIVPIQLIYSKLARNSDFTKTASGDPLMAIELAKRLAEEDKDLGESSAITYFPGQREDLHEVAVSNTDKSIVYGGENAIKTIKNLSKRYGKKFIDHGPRRSLWYVENSNEENANRIVEDTIPFEQVSCISPYISFVNNKNDVEELAKKVLSSSINYSKEFPPTPNWEAIRKKENRWKRKGGKVFTPMQVAKEQGISIEKREDNYFRIVTLPEELELDEETENEIIKDAIYRFVFLKPVENEKEVIDYLDKSNLKNYISRIAGDNHGKLKKYAEENMPLTESCEIGNVCNISPEEKHDGYYDLLNLFKN